MIHQLRIYEIFESNRKAFHDRFRDHAVPIMARYGFHIRAMWECRNGDRLEFIYLLVWPDAETLTGAWDSFMADDEWAAIKRRTAALHGDLVGDIQDRRLNLTDYSPAAPGLTG
ncbi:MAG: NIPSNAP family protein [Alphaproteobacteria bacterium]